MRFRCFILAVLLPATLTAEPAVDSPKPPNFILLLADDLGYGDLGVTGSRQIPTPHIDLLSANGVRFSSALVSSSVCAPSRAGHLADPAFKVRRQRLLDYATGVGH
jgi:hypothetical protein